jgi:hypothetical protein
MWTFIAGTKYEKLVKPNIGRWGSVGDCAKTLLENWDIWHEMAKSIISAHMTDVNSNTLASWLDSYMNDPGLKAQVIFVVFFHKLVWNKHFQWLKEEDVKSKLAGFRSVDMTV